MKHFTPKITLITALTLLSLLSAHAQNGFAGGGAGPDPTRPLPNSPGPDNGPNRLNPGSPQPIPAAPQPPGAPNQAFISAGMMQGGGGFGGMAPEQNFYRASMRQESRNLILGAHKLDAATVSNMEEDLTVMSRILDKTIEGSYRRTSQALGIALFTSPNAATPQSLYLEGYGVLFQMNVGFPLLPTAAGDQDKLEKPTDSPWEQARREIYGSRDGGREMLIGGPGVGPKYDSDRVESLKKELLDNLKLASNIRNLKPDDTISLAITGADNPSVIMHNGRNVPNRVIRSAGVSTSTTVVQRGPQVPGAAPDRVEVMTVNEGPSAGRPTVLTIRVKKSDVDSFAKGKMTLDEFRNKAVINAY